MTAIEVPKQSAPIRPVLAEVVQEAPMVEPHDSSTMPGDRSSSYTANGSTPPPGSTHPWRRFFAKFTDISTLGMLGYSVFVMLTYLAPQQNEQLVAVRENTVIGGFLVIVIWCPMEACFLSFLGYTPAKWLYGIEVRSTIGAKLSFGKALERAFLSGIQGLGGGLPIVSLVTQLFAYDRLNKTGTTLWDTSMKSVVSHAQWGPFRAIVCVVAGIAVLLLNFMILLIANTS